MKKEFNIPRVMTVKLTPQNAVMDNAVLLSADAVRTSTFSLTDSQDLSQDYKAWKKRN